MDKDIQLINLHKTLNNETITRTLLNNKNRLITKDYIKKTLELYGLYYIPKDIKIFQLAMTHVSYINKDYTIFKNFKKIFENNLILDNNDNNAILEWNKINKNFDLITLPLQQKSYDVLEFRGDVLLKDIISDYIVCRYHTFEPKELTDLRSTLEKRNSFSNISKLLGLHKYVLISKNLELKNFRDTNLKMQCDIFESFIGALFYDMCNISSIDFGNNTELMKINRGEAYQKINTFIINLIEDNNKCGWNLSEILEINTNYKQVIQNYYIHNKWGYPIYKMINVDEKQDGKILYEIGICDNNKNICAIGKSTSKKMAEQLSAKNALIHFNVDFKNEENDEEEIEITDTGFLIF